MRAPCEDVSCCEYASNESLSIVILFEDVMRPVVFQ